MRLSEARVQQTLSQFEAQAIPENHPALGQLKELFGDHTFFVDANGLNIVEPIQHADSGSQAGKVVNLANWADDDGTRLQPHAPEPTETVVLFAPEDRSH